MNITDILAFLLRVIHCEGAKTTVKITRDEKEHWLTSKNGHRFMLDDDTGNIKAGFGGTIKNIDNRSKIKQIILPRKEYAQVNSAINNVYYARFKDREYCSVEVGDYRYQFHNNGFSDYIIYGKIRIDGNEAIIAKMKASKR